MYRVQIQKSRGMFSDSTSGLGALELQHLDTEEVDQLSGNCSAASSKRFFSCLE